MQLVKHCEPSGEAPNVCLRARGRAGFTCQKGFQWATVLLEWTRLQLQLLVSLWLTASEHALLIAWYSEFSLHFKGTITQWLPNAGLE